MLFETVSFFVCFVLLTLIGIGPALLLVPRGERRIIYAFGIAPVLGMSVIALTGFLLVRYVSPIKTWAEILTALFSLAGLIILFKDWGLNRRDYGVFTNKRNAAIATIFLFVCMLILAGPMLVGGIQYSIFLNNASDAFTYMSVSEALRVVDWQTLFEGADFRNSEGVARLAEKSPTSLFSARYVLMPYRLGTCILLGWASEIIDIPVYRFYYAFNLLSFATAIPLVLALGTHLGLRLYMRFGVAAAITLGFFAHFIREQDISSQMNSIPLFMLVAFAWMQMEKELLQKASRSRILLAVSISALLCYYPETLTILSLSFVVYYVVGILQKTVSLAAVRYHIYTTVLILIISIGQIDYHLRSIFLGYNNIFNSIPYSTESHILVFLERDFFLTAWGLLPFMSNLANLPNTFFWESLPAVRNLYYSHEEIKTLLYALSGIMSISFIGALLFMIRKKNDPADKIVLSFIATSLITFTFFYFRNNYYPAGKALMIFYPFYFLALPLLPKYLSDFKYLAFKPTKALFSLSIAIWLALQAVLGLNWIDMAQYQKMIIEIVSQPKQEQYDLSQITKYLDNAPTGLLLVNIPRGKTWAFAYYAIFVFSKYKTFFQDGIITDNSVDPDNFPAGELMEIPDYAVISKTIDYIGPNNLGVKLSETNELTLYKITSDDINDFMGGINKNNNDMSLSQTVQYGTKKEDN